MPTRRAALSAIGLALAGAAGCLDGDGEPGGSSGAGATGLAALPEPTLDGDREFHLVVDVDLAALRESQGPLVEADGELGQFVEQHADELPGIDLQDVDHVAGQLVGGSASGDDAIAAVISGDLDQDAVEQFVEEESSDTDYETGEYEGYAWYAPEDAVIAVGDGQVLVSVSGHAEDAPSSRAAATVDAASSGDRWFADDGRLVDVVDGLSGHPNVVAVSVAPSVVEDEDPPLGDFAAGGLGTTPESDSATIDVTAQFRGDVDPNAVGQLVKQFTADASGVDPVVDELEFEGNDGTVGASATVDGETLSQSSVGPVVRFPPLVLSAYVVGIGGSDRPATPQVVFDFEQRDDGRVEITHHGGDTVQEPLSITYVADGDRVRESWREPDGIQAGDSYVTERAGDTGTRLQVSWTGDDGQSHLLGEFHVS